MSGQTVRDLILKVTVEAPNTAKFDKDAKKMVESLNRVTDAAAKSSKSVAQISKEMEGTRKKVQDNAVKVGDALTKAASGAFTLARGIALASIAGEEDLKKVIEQVAKVQAAFDIFKGTTSLIKSLGAVTKTLSTVSTVATTSELALAGANTAVATTGAAAATSMKALVVSLGPIGIALVVAGAAYALMTKKSKATEEQSRKTAEALDAQSVSVRSLSDRLSSLGTTGGEALKFRLQENIADLDKAQKNIELRTKNQLDNLQKIANATLAPRGQKKLFSSNIDELKTQLKLVIEINKRFSGLPLALRPTLQDLRKLGEGQERFTKTFLDVAKTQSTFKDRLDAVKDASELLSRITEEQIKAEGDRFAIERRRTALLSERVQKQKEEFTIASKNLEVAKQFLKQDDDRLRNLKQRFGGLSAAEQSNTKRAFERLNLGLSPSRGDISLIEPFDPTKAAGLKEKRFAQGGGPEFFKEIGLGRQGQQREQQADLFRQVAERERDVLKKLQDSLKTQNEIRQGIAEAVAQSQEVFESIKSDLSDFTSFLETYNLFQKSQ